jgi:hypothetical protein
VSLIVIAANQEWSSTVVTNRSQKSKARNGLKRRKKDSGSRAKPYVKIRSTLEGKENQDGRLIWRLNMSRVAWLDDNLLYY